MQTPTPAALDPEDDLHFAKWIALQRQHAEDLAADPDLDSDNPILMVQKYFDQMLNGQMSDDPGDSPASRKAWSLVCSLRRLEAAIQRCYAATDAHEPALAVPNGTLLLLVWTVDELLLFKDKDGR